MIALTPEQRDTLAAMLGEANGDSLHPIDVADAARAKSSPLHDLFDWDQKEHTRYYLAQRARLVLESFFVMVKRAKQLRGQPAEVFVRAAVSVGDGYSDVRKVMRNRDRARGQVVTDWRRIDSLIGRLSGIAALREEYAMLGAILDTAREDVAGILGLELEGGVLRR